MTHPIQNTARLRGNIAQWGILVASLSLAVFAAGCGDQGTEYIEHDVDGFVEFYPYDVEQQRMIPQAEDCSTEAYIALDTPYYPEPGDYYFVIECKGRFTLEWSIPTDQEELDEHPIGDITVHDHLIATYERSGDIRGGEPTTAEWSREWLENCSPERFPIRNWIERVPVEGETVEDAYPPVRARFDFRFECIRGEVEVELNTR